MRLPSRQNQKNLFFIMLLLLVPSIACAGLFLDPIEADFKKAILGGNPGWQTIITSTAKKLFWGLVSIDWAWAFIGYVKDRKEVGEILSSYIGKIFTVGFYWMLLMSAGTWIPALIGLFADTGKDVATATGAQVGTLDSVFSQGVHLAEKIMETLDDLSLLERTYLVIPAAFGAFCAAIGFALVAGQLLVTLIESYIAIGAGIIMLGFGGSRWTSDMATGYLKFAIGTGLKLMLCYMIIGLGYRLFNGAIPNDALNDPGLFFTYIFRVVALVLIYVYLVFNIPGIASAIISGSPNMSLGGMAGAAITAAAAAASGGVAAAATTGKAAALGGAVAAEGGGIAKAVGEGFKANKASGMGNVASALMAPVPMIKSAASMLGAKAVDAGKGSVEGGKGALGKAGDAINNSVGGKVAADIAAKSEAAGKTETATENLGAADAALKDTATPVAGKEETPSQPTTKSNTNPAGDGAIDAGNLATSVSNSANQLKAGNPAAGKAETPGQPITKSNTNAAGDGAIDAGNLATSVSDSANQLNAGNPVAAGRGNPVDGQKQSKDAASGGGVGSGGGGDTGGSVGGEAPTSSLPEGRPSSIPGEKLGELPSALGGNETGQAIGDKGSQLNEPGGDASDAKVGASDPHTRLLEAIDANMAKMKQMESNAAVGGESGREQKPKLSEKIQGLQRFVPQDAASVAAAPITMGHTRD